MKFSEARRRTKEEFDYQLQHFLNSKFSITFFDKIKAVCINYANKKEAKKWEKKMQKSHAKQAKLTSTFKNKF